VKSKKAKAKANLSCSIRDRQRMGVGTVHGPHNLSKHGHEDAESTLSLLHQSQGKSGKVTFWCMWKSPYFDYCPEIHMKSIWHAQKFMCSFIHDEPRWRSWWSQMKIIINTTTFWCSSEIRMFALNFKLKLVGPRTHGITPLDTLQRLYELKDPINRDQGLSKTCTIAKHTRKQLELFKALAIEIGYHWRLFLPSCSVHQYPLLSLSKITSSSSFFVCFSNIQPPYKL